MKHFLLFYDYVPDMMERRAPIRPAHLALIRAAMARGEIVMAGALVDQPAGGVLVFKGESDDVARRFVAEDPYVAAGLVTNWRVREWAIVGPEAPRS